MDRILQGEGPFTAYDLSAIPDKPYAGHTDCLSYSCGPFPDGCRKSGRMAEMTGNGGFVILSNKKYDKIAVVSRHRPEAIAIFG